ncbi:hypothetical protein FJ950_13450 [Mesorhizobium sp. B2-3-14]|uniref:hypothetical protein n=1 Tax=unclassified Mesorhizobium TaxID=325217 RepID=UPI00112DD573|nr:MULTISPECIES: hypothetical protein [unclassified Mesorhizobium]MBZ9722989.1 hypothetical protein [Mesorhizobium sp. CO1-1-11]TPL85743.1 hypothetical protein FJ950_13450 [Mesorhizobium sp. B2-3-14]
MGRRFISTVVCLLLLNAKAVAGWYHVENYEGFLGPSPIHFSIQTYDSLGSAPKVDGSYFYDAKQSPIALYGTVTGTKFVLCEISDDKEFYRIIVQGPRPAVDTTSCPFSLDLNGNAVTGSWSKGTDRYPVTLKKIASLDDTGEAKIDGTVEISFWAQTATDRFSGIYTNTSAGLCMEKMRVIKKSSRKVVQEITFADDDACSAGMLMTTIYMNVEKWVERGKDVISVNFRGGGAGTAVDYVFNSRTRKYQRRK